VVNQYVIPAKKHMPVSQLKKTDQPRVHEDMTRKYGIRANQAIKEKLSLNEIIRSPAENIERSSFMYDFIIILKC
jgi:hypothetical protein